MTEEKTYSEFVLDAYFFSEPIFIQVYPPQTVLISAANNETQTAELYALAPGTEVVRYLGEFFLDGNTQLRLQPAQGIMVIDPQRPMHPYGGSVYPGDSITIDLSTKPGSIQIVHKGEATDDQQG